MIRVRTGSRLHFGFLHLPGNAPAASGHEGLVRSYGGVGVMVESPGLEVCFEPGRTWTAEGPLAERALAYARQIPDAQPGRLVVGECPPEHHGLGVGTQLGLCVARVLDASTDVLGLARLVGRGKRSALGIHGFAQGGFLVEGGKKAADDETMNGMIAPLVARVPFPEEWRVVLVLPTWRRGLAGAAEQQALQLLAGQAVASTDALCRLVLLGMLPSLVERDVPAFGEALYEFNRRVGEIFLPVQGGLYSHPQSADVVAFIRKQGVRGVGQSSWGPGLFAVVDSAEMGLRLQEQLLGRFPFHRNDVLVTKVMNHGAHCS